MNAPVVRRQCRAQGPWFACNRGLAEGRRGAVCRRIFLIDGLLLCDAGCAPDPSWQTRSGCESPPRAERTKSTRASAVTRRASTMPSRARWVSGKRTNLCKRSGALLSSAPSGACLNPKVALTDSSACRTPSSFSAVNVGFEAVLYETFSCRTRG